MEKDSHIEVANMTKILTDYIRNKVASLIILTSVIIAITKCDLFLSLSGQRNTVYQRG